MTATEPSETGPDATTPTQDKAYADRDSTARAAGNYRWLTSLAPPLRLPRLLAEADHTLRFEHLEGAHAVPGDLVVAARHLGDVHAASLRSSLRRADLRSTFSVVLIDGRQQRIPGFLDGRVDAIGRALASGVVPAPLFDADEAFRRMAEASSEPAAFYKDSNPRNVLVPLVKSETTPATIDFDDLTLAPFGYDLAKLVVGLAMTHGRLPEALVSDALAAYNSATHALHADAPTVSPAQFMTWAEIHHILTSRYAGRHGYQHSWHNLRPQNLSRPSAAHDPGPTN